MTKVKFERGVEANLPSSGMAEEGHVFISTDKGNAYLGLSDGSLKPFNRSPYYGTSSTSGGTNTKVVSLDVDEDNFSLTAGVMISVKFEHANTASSPTLNVNNKGAVAVKAYGTTAVGSNELEAWHDDEVVTFIYDGSYWMRTGSSYSKNKNPYFAICNTAANVSPKEATVVGSDEFVLEEGTVVFVKFTHENAFLRAKLSVNGLPSGGAYIRKGSVLLSNKANGSWNEEEVVCFVYAKTNAQPYWQLATHFLENATPNVTVGDVTTNGVSGLMSAEDKTKLDGVAVGAQVNIIETVKVNGTDLTVDANKAVDVTVPTDTEDLTNNAGFITSASVPSPADTDPLMDGTVAVGISTDYAREDHVHPTDTSRVAMSDPRLYDDYDIANTLTISNCRNSYIYTPPSNWNYSSTYKHWIVSLEGVRKVSITASSTNAAYIAFLKNYQVNGNTSSSSKPTSDFAGDIQERITIKAGTTKEFIVPDDAEVLYLGTGNTSDSNTPSKPQNIKFTGLAITRVEEAMTEDGKDPLTSTSVWEDTVVANYRDHSLGRNYYENERIESGYYISTVTGKWGSMSGYYFIRMKLPRNVASVKVSANSNGARYAFLKQLDSPSSGNTPIYANNESIHVVDANETDEYNVPSDAVYLYVALGSLSDNVYAYLPDVYFTGTKGVENFRLGIGNGDFYDGSTPMEISVFEGTDSNQDSGVGLVPVATAADAGKYLKGDGTWGTPGGGSSITVMTGATGDTDGASGAAPQPLAGQHQFVLAGSAEWRQAFHLGCGVMGTDSSSYVGKWYKALEGWKADNTATDETIVLLVTRHTTGSPSTYSKGIFGLLVVDIRSSSNNGTTHLNKSWSLSCLDQVKNSVEVTTVVDNGVRYVRVYLKTGQLGGYSAKILSSSGFSSLTSSSEMKWRTWSVRANSSTTLYSNIPSGETVATNVDRPVQIATPTSSSHAATKGYVDGMTYLPAFVHIAGAETITGKKTFEGGALFGGHPIEIADGIATVEIYKDSDSDAEVLTIGMPVSGQPNADIRLRGVESPTSDNDAANKAYVDGLTGFVPIGGTAGKGGLRPNELCAMGIDGKMSAFVIPITMSAHDPINEIAGQGFIFNLPSLSIYIGTAVAADPLGTNPQTYNSQRFAHYGVFDIRRLALMRDNLPSSWADEGDDVYLALDYINGPKGCVIPVAVPTSGSSLRGFDNDIVLSRKMINQAISEQTYIFDSGVEAGILNYGVCYYYIGRCVGGYNVLLETNHETYALVRDLMYILNIK